MKGRSALMEAWHISFVGINMAALRLLVPLSLSLAMASAFLVVPPQSVLKAGEVVSVPASFFSSPPAMQQGGRTKGALYSLVINPKRQGISQLGIEEIKAKKALLMAPSDLQGAVLVSGSLEEEVFTLLNEQRVWNRITAFAADAASARKRLTSRSTRYSGVLDMLNLEEGDPHDLNVLETYLSTKSYAAWLDLSPEDADETQLLAKAKLAAATGIKFFVTAVSLSQARLEKQDLDLELVEKILRDAGIKFRILVTGQVIPAPATGYVRLNDTEILMPNATIARGDLARIATELFLVADEKPEAGVIYASEGDDSVVGYLKHCREQGMNYKTEITDQLAGGLYTYKDKVAASMQELADKAAGVLAKGARKDTELYAAYRVNVTKAAIATEYDKKRRTLVGMVKKIVGDILEEEYDDMYFSMRTKEDLDLYKKANWQRAVNLVLGMLMGKGEEAGGRDKASQRLTGFQDPYLGPQWHIIRSNAAVMIKIKELHDEIGERLTREDWERYDILEGDFMGDEEAVMTMKIEEKTKRNKDYLRETLIAPPRRKASLIVEVDEIDSYRTALLESRTGRKGALPSPAPTQEEAEAKSVVVEVVDEGGKEGEEVVVATAPTKRGRKRKTAEGEE